jgi:hypothetical protein
MRWGWSKSAEEKEKIHSQDHEDAMSRLLTARTALERSLELETRGEDGTVRPLRRVLLDLGDPEELETIIENDLRRVKDMVRTNG